MINSRLGKLKWNPYTGKDRMARFSFIPFPLPWPLSKPYFPDALAARSGPCDWNMSEIKVDHF